MSEATPPAVPLVVREALAPRAVAPKPASRVDAIDYSKAFANATSYWDFAYQILAAANAGNADAQYYLWRAMNRCASDNKMFFVHRGKVLTLDQGLQWAQTRELSTDVARTTYEKCHEFLVTEQTDVGNADDWLAKATASGQPQAQAATALAQWNQHALASIQSGAGVADVSAAGADAQDPRTLLRQAVMSKNPDVLFAIGEAQGYLVTPGSDTKINQLAWWLVACERGLDCSSDAEWVKISCMRDSRCAAITDSTQFVKILADQDWNSVQESAAQISAKLYGNQWDDLGLGSG